MSNVQVATLRDDAFECNAAVQYFRNEQVRIIYDEADRQSYKDVNLSNKHQKKLVFLKSLGGRWVFEFDRSSATSIQSRIWFCKECGQPFDRFTEMGSHENEKKCKLKKHVAEAQAANADEEEEAAVAALLKGEEETAEIEAVDPEKVKRNAEIKAKRIAALNKAREAKRAKIAETQPVPSTEVSAQV